MKTSIKATNKNGTVKIKAKGKTIEQLDIIALILCRLIIKKSVTNEDALLGYIKNQMQSFKKNIALNREGRC